MAHYLRLYIINSFLQSNIFDSLIYPLLVGLLLFFLECFWSKKKVDVDKHFTQLNTKYLSKNMQKDKCGIPHLPFYSQYRFVNF